MILDELILHDFGVYRGRQVFPLTPESPERPIILIGAQNGGGKTTFLEGLQLAFFGRLSHGGFRGGAGYDDYLRQAIHRGASPQDGASVEVKFRRTLEGREQSFWIKRVWSVQKSAVRETFEARVNGELDRVLTAQWAEYVEEMLPPRIAPLFFFDGERIEQFADIARSSEIIGTAINALLGLDIVERLQLDLDVFERRKAVQNASTEGQEELRAAAAAVEERQVLVDQRHYALGELSNQRGRRQAALENARSDFRSHGGGLFEAQNEVLADSKLLEAELSAIERNLRVWAGDLAPLMLVEELLGDVARQAEVEAEAEDARAVAKFLGKRDAQLMKRLRGSVSNGMVLHEIQSFLDEDRRKLLDRASAGRDLDLSRGGREALFALIEHGLPATVEARRSLLDALEDTIARKDDADRRAAAMPAAETIAPLKAQVLVEEETLVAVEAAFIVAQREYDEAKRLHADARTAYQRILERHVEARLQAEDAQRMLEHSARVRDTLARFRTDVVAHHVDRIEALVLQALHALLHKSNLVAGVTIDRESFAITLNDRGGEHVPPEQLSAGERQLFAISLLWALAKASGQAAPTVIDTPLGRLDSAHRDRLIETYFPHAGHQVILLSTDEEIGPRHYERLAPRITRSLSIVYDDETRASQLVDGYQFAASPLEIA